MSSSSSLATPCSALLADRVSRPGSSVSLTGRERSWLMAATRATASAKSFLPTRKMRVLLRGITRSYSGNVPSISLDVRVTGPAVNWMRVSESAISTSSGASSISLRTSATVLRGTITPGIPAAPAGKSASTRARRCPSVATARSLASPSTSVPCRKIPLR